MERSNFIKIIATLIAAPGLLGEIKEIPSVSENYEGENLNGVYSIRIYTEMAAKIRVGDIIESDMGDRALITAIVLIGDHFIEARPVMRNKYRYNRLDSFRVCLNTYTEY